LFTPADLTGLLEAASLTIRHRFGDYAGGPPTAAAPRIILTGVRA
jgi:hypothetical protein